MIRFTGKNNFDLFSREVNNKRERKRFFIRIRIQVAVKRPLLPGLFYIPTVLGRPFFIFHDYPP